MCSKSIRKRKIFDENPFFQVILNKVLIISADVEANKNEIQEIKRSGICISKKIYKKVLWKVKTWYPIKKRCVFVIWLCLVAISSSLILSTFKNNNGLKEGVFNRQNSLKFDKSYLLMVHCAHGLKHHRLLTLNRWSKYRNTATAVALSSW